ncbi:MAG: hypothetical protein HGA70_06120 [Chlorobiaceae bacterium]|nr:hypothetical protein [Chlorobiaceae bacterium]NTW09961.1 hypothetical protein [Chlorobiaceae bacterium]
MNVISIVKKSEEASMPFYRMENHEGFMKTGPSSSKKFVPGTPFEAQKTIEGRICGFDAPMQKPEGSPSDSVQADIDAEMLLYHGRCGFATGAEDIIRR